MKGFERTTLSGAFLVLLGVFAPWHGFIYDYPVPGAVSEHLRNVMTGTVTGYHLVPGLAVLTASVLLAVTGLVPKGGEPGRRVLCSQAFLTAVILGLLVVGGVAPLSHPGVSPRIGLALVLVGALAAVVGIRQGFRDLDSR